MARRVEDSGNPLSPRNPEKEQPPAKAIHPEHDPRRPPKPRDRYTLILLVGIMVTCLALIYYLANTRYRLDGLSLSLLKTRGELTSFGARLEETWNQSSKLKEGLTETRDQTAEQQRQLELHSQQLREKEAQYRRLSAGIRKMRADYRRELQAIEQEKADRTEVKQLEQDVQSLKSDTDALKQKVVQTETPVPENEVSTPVPATAASQATAQNYDFQLQREDGVLWLLNVGLDLKKVKLSETDAIYDLEVRVDGTKVTKKNTHVNEPIYVQTEGSNQPYRVVVTKIEKDQVKGYLIVPKVSPQADRGLACCEGRHGG